MVNEKECEIVRIYKFGKSDQININSLVEACELIATQNNIPIYIQEDKIGSGGLFSNLHPCVILYNPIKKDEYFHFTIYLGEIKKRPAIYVAVFGKSKNRIKREEFRAKMRTVDGGGHMFRTGVSGLLNVNNTSAFGNLAAGTLVVGGAVKGVVKLARKGVNALLRDNASYKEENTYYNNLIQIFDSVLA